MEYTSLGDTDLRVSRLGFGCGAVGGLLVRGEPAEMVRVVARALELGVTYFDTAQIYGNGTSETNLGRVLQELKPDVVVGTKVRLTSEQMEDIPTAVVASVEGSLQRLQLERLDLIQLHNPIAGERQAQRGWIGVDDLPAVTDTFCGLHSQSKVRYWGLNGLGETEALHQAVEATDAHSVQICYNLLNPSAALVAPEGFPFQDYQQLMNRAAEKGTGTIAIRVLAGGALSGHDERDPVAAGDVAPIATGASYGADVAYARGFQPLVDQGHVESLVEAAIRFVLNFPEVCTALVGISTMDQLEEAARYAERGPLPAETLRRIRVLRDRVLA